MQKLAFCFPDRDQEWSINYNWNVLDITQKISRVTQNLKGEKFTFCHRHFFVSPLKSSAIHKNKYSQLLLCNATATF
jgi:hypothetical protein